MKGKSLPDKAKNIFLSQATLNISLQAKGLECHSVWWEHFGICPLPHSMAAWGREELISICQQQFVSRTSVQT
jgi:hypothetical protein